MLLPSYYTALRHGVNNNTTVSGGHRGIVVEGLMVSQLAHPGALDLLHDTRHAIVIIDAA